MASVRRLTAILAADVAGYSRLMGTDEEAALSRWHLDYADEFAEFLTLEAPFRR
jgi:class 3 adenylate cyclase